MSEPSTWPGFFAKLTLRAALWPPLAADLLALCWAFRRRGWWRRVPFLPLPDREYLAWRLHTAYGEAPVIPPVADVVRFARWRRRILRP